MAIIDGKKRCPRCGESKPPEGFYRNAKASDGLSSCCRPCAIAYELARPKPPMTEAVREMKRLAARIYREANRDVLNARRKERYVERYQANMRAYWAEHKDEINARRRAKKRGRVQHGATRFPGALGTERKQEEETS